LGALRLKRAAHFPAFRPPGFCLFQRRVSILEEFLKA
jgi:hypothetical protein